jgi:hypothetical protein
MRRVAEEIGGQSVELAEEFVLTNAELSFLPERKQAYENMATRTGLESVKSVSQALIQAERYGTPVAQALRVLASESRDQRMNAAEKKAAALPPKLTVPMILFFLPVLFAVILGPAGIQVSERGIFGDKKSRAAISGRLRFLPLREGRRCALSPPFAGGEKRFGEAKRKAPEWAFRATNARSESGGLLAKSASWRVGLSPSQVLDFAREGVPPCHVDFVCLEKLLILEVDGGQHSASKRDEVRDSWLAGQGFKVVRFWNDEVERNLDGVCLTILRETGQ